jgi:Uma2 family endonuclease
MRLSTPLDVFVTKQDFGIVLDSEAKYRLARDPDLVRRPDISFVSWQRLPGRQIPVEDVVDFAPDLAVEIISPTNRATEIEQKIEDYFANGVRLVWVVYPDQKHVYVYDAPNKCRILQPGDSLDGGVLLPGFHVTLTDLFSELSPTNA